MHHAVSPLSITKSGSSLGHLQWLLWAVFFVGPLFFIPQCLDRYLAPRFMYLSAVLLVAALLALAAKSQNPRIPESPKPQFSILNPQFSLLLLAWYALNVASVSWAFSWSEAVFYAQKVSLLVGVYALLLVALHRDEAATRHILRRITVGLTWTLGGIVAGQLMYAGLRYGLQNEQLYEYASGLSGNKSLAAEFLFFLLIFNVLFSENDIGSAVVKGQQSRVKSHFWLRIAFLLALILLLQVRTAYLALAAAALLYVAVRAAAEPAFRGIFLKKILPAGVLALCLAAGLLALKGRGNSLAERLNPMTYLESASANERRFVWYKTDLLNQEHRWWGVGNGSWKFWFPSKSLQGGYRLQEENIVFTRAHNDYLEVRSEMGLAGAALYCGLFMWAFGAGIGAMRRARRAGDQHRFHDVLVLLAGLLGYCIVQFFDFPRERPEMQMVLAFFFAYLAWQSQRVAHLSQRVAHLEGVPHVPDPRGTWSDFFLEKKMSRPAVFVLLGGAALVLIFNVLVGWKRVVGEMHTVRMLEAQSRGDHRSTVREAEAAINLFNEYDDTATPLAWYAGVAHFQMGNTAAAVSSFREAYRLNPWSFQVMNNYASALMKLGQFQDAVPLLERAVAVNPKFDDGKFNLAYTWFQLADYPRALDWLNRVDTLPNPQTEQQRQRNRAVLAKQAEFRAAILEKMN